MALLAKLALEQDCCVVGHWALSFKRPPPAETGSLAGRGRTFGESKAGPRQEMPGAPCSSPMPGTPVLIVAKPRGRTFEDPRAEIRAHR